MTRAIQLGANAIGTAAPNPMVGAVLVMEDKILAEGFTSAYGGAHAEVNAINNVADTSLLSKSALYVTLEPCSHFGKTPPCADLILKYGIPEVFIGIKDPNPEVSGRGIERLRKAGCKVKTGILADACRDHHRRFLSVHEKKRPYIILKWAQSADGYLAPEDSRREQNAAPFWISNSRSRQLVHQWRSQEQGILVGKNTVLKDNPALDTRLWRGKSPLRIFIDKDLAVSGNFKILNGPAKTLIFTRKEVTENLNNTVSFEVLDFDRNVVPQVCARLIRLGVNSLIVEGGAYTLQQFINDGIWDEARIFTGEISLGKGLKAPSITGNVANTSQIGDTHLKILRND
jgi:diaminohydroxyphosphoribosylaminopyrimidine deaminase/5-amino-6-(5-phosphoribosylamino)uracil reductase